MSHRGDEVDEQSTLLKHDDLAETPHGQESLPATANSPPISLIYVRYGCILLNFLVEMCDMIIIVPTIALLERSICYTYYAEHDPHVIGPGGLVNERLCKIGPVQEQLAVLRGWKALFEALPGHITVWLGLELSDWFTVMLVAIPLGTVADRFGRKLVFYSSIFGSVTALLWTLLICMWFCALPCAWVLSFLSIRPVQSYFPNRNGLFVCHLPFSRQLVFC